MSRTVHRARRALVVLVLAPVGRTIHRAIHRAGRALVVLVLALAATVAAVAATSQPAAATVRSSVRYAGSCRFTWQVATLGSGASTYIRAENNACLWIRARRSGDTTWRGITNPAQYAAVYLAQGNNTWVEFRAKGEITVNGIDTALVHCNIAPGDWADPATISCGTSYSNT